MSAQVWCLGDAVVDLLPEGDGRLMQCAGGAPANVAVGIARLEGKSGFIGRVGQDPFGKFMYDTLRQEKVNTDYMTFDEAQRTSTVVVALTTKASVPSRSWCAPAPIFSCRPMICQLSAGVVT
jgi:fructokinase